MAALLEPGFYDELANLPGVGSPRLVSSERSGDVVTVRVHYRFTGELSAAARAVLDPAKLSWTEESAYDLAARTAAFRMVPDNYGDRFRCSGTSTFTATGGGTLRRVEGELTVRAPLVGGAVERAIVSGLREHLAAEAPVLERWAAGEGRP